ncbi:MAG TPA: ATP-binding protein, partial [Allocoleopsis sp.]
VNSTELLIRLTAQDLAEHFGDLRQIQSSHQLSFRHDQQTELVQVAPFTDGRGLDWLIVVVIPESDFMAEIYASTRSTILLCFVALLLAIVFGILTSRWISQPLLQMVAASRSIASGDLNQTVKPNGIKELETLAQSFNQMATQLNSAFEELEYRVAERTAQLRSAKESADAANRTKSEFLARMSHELRTPLNAILGFTQLLQQKPALRGVETELNIIHQSGEHLLDLVNDVLEMSKIEAGQITLNPAPFDLYQLLNALKEMLELRASAKGLQLVFNYAANVPQFIQTDARKLRQVLLNLIGNAIKFTTIGGITLRVARIDPPVPYDQTIPSDRHAPLTPVTLLPPPSPETIHLHFEVEDTGAGIPPEDQATIFEPFVQSDAGLQSKEGTGLGLPISQKFVQLMGGTISLESQLGEGTTVRFDVVVQPAEATTLQTVSSIQRQVMGLAPGQPQYRILVVDDRWTNRHLLVQLLTSKGFEVREAENGQEAVTLWQSWHPHLIWMDMRMPLMDGYTATQIIKSHPEAKTTIIIALTASSLSQEESVVLAAGCADFVRKPFKQETIFEKMAQHLGVRYLYQDSHPDSSIHSRTVPDIQPGDLTVMPPDWIDQLYTAATLVDNKAIFRLLQQIPADRAHLSETLATWVHNFRCDKIISLIEQLHGQQPDSAE